MIKSMLLLALSISFFSLNAQVRIYRTFKDTRVINSPSVEITPRKKLDVRIAHRFGDIAGDQGGWETLYGLENAEDVLIGLEAGLSDNLAVGVFRTKGAGQLRQLVNTTVKYRLAHQTSDDAMPVSIVLYGLGSLSTMPSSEDPESLANFGKFIHRIAYHGQLIVARKFSDRFSLQLSGGYLHRNQVVASDENGLAHIGGAFRLQVTKIFGLIVDVAAPISDLRTTDNGFYTPVGIGIEIETGGHVFQVNLTNATGIMESDYLANTVTNWGDGEFRLGFTVSRLFNL